MPVSILIEDELAAEARELGINVSDAARHGLRRAIRRRRAELDRRAYQDHPEVETEDWDDAQAWGNCAAVATALGCEAP